MGFRGGDDGGAAGAAHLSVITAITISGCSLLFLALLRGRLAPKEGGDPSSSSGGIIKSKEKKKQVVRFAAEVEEPRGSGAEYRARLRLQRRRARQAVEAGGERGSVGGRPAEERLERRRKTAALYGSGAAAAVGGNSAAIPANQRALYRGLCQYRSQMATLMLYHT